MQNKNFTEESMRENIWNTDLSGKVVAITGAGGVLCSYFARVISRAGGKVALLDRNAKRSAEIATEITSMGGIAEAFACDVLDKQSCIDAAQKVKQCLGGCDILINGAGGNNPSATTDREYFSKSDNDSEIKSFFSLTEDGVRQVLDLNFLGTFIPTQVFAQQMIGKSGCSILNISSMNAYRPLTKIPAYSGAKAAVSNLTQWLAVYFSRVGIRVNAIAPGFFSTQQNATLLWNADGSPTERTKKILAATPMGRFGNCEELEGSLLFLLDAKASGFVTGIVLPVDGGFSAYSGV